MAACIDDAKIDKPDEGLNGVTIWGFLEHVRARYATINQTLIHENLAEFKKLIQADVPLAIYTRKQDKPQCFVAELNVPISKATTFTTGTNHALQCGDMTLYWREWKRCPENNNAWNNSKSDWTLVFNKTRYINHITAGNHFGHANSVMEDKLSKKMTNSLDNIVNSVVRRNNTIEYSLCSQSLNIINSVIAEHVMPNFQLLKSPRKLPQGYAVANEALQILEIYASMKANPDTLFEGSIIDDKIGKSLEYCCLI